MNSLEEVKQIWKDEPQVHDKIKLTFEEKTNSVPKLKEMRDFVEKEGYGFGERAFYHMWSLIVDKMPQMFTFLEIGVYKGQILALMRMLALLKGKDCSIVGITPLDETDGYMKCDYLADIKNLHKHFDIEGGYLIIKGLSTDSLMVEYANGWFLDQLDILYIDGGHATEVVKKDIKNYTRALKVGGYLVMDDCANRFKMPSGHFRGHQSVSNAVDELLPPYANNDKFEFLFNVVHNRIWIKK